MPGEIVPVTMTQQYTFGGNEINNAAKFCCDKDLSTHAAATATDGEMWLKLEIDKVYLLLQVVVYTRFYNNWFDPAHTCINQGKTR